MKISYFKSPIGMLKIEVSQRKLISLQFTNDTKIVDNQDEITEKCKKQLNEYFCGKRKIFDLPTQLEGTEFQKKVWKALCKIPYGTTVSYQEIAQKIGKEKAVRAVGTAIGKNPIAIIVPCHRVISANGKIGGYAYGVDKKQKLLDLERNFNV